MNRYSKLKDEIKISPKLHLQKHRVQTYILLLGITDDEYFHLHMGNKQTLSFTRFDIPDLFRLNLELIYSLDSSKSNCIKDSEILNEDGCYDYQRFTKFEPEFKFCGWRVSKSIICLVLTEFQLTMLQDQMGAPLENITHKKSTHLWDRIG
tara:strand:- start:619 stop:1071 length:453 start_codon:yes stop_codon:yes gene_type:complete